MYSFFLVHDSRLNLFNVLKYKNIAVKAKDNHLDDLGLLMIELLISVPEQRKSNSS